MTQERAHTYVGAYLSRGDAQSLESLLDLLEKEKVITRTSPDLFARAYRKFGVDEAEDVRGRGRARPIAGAHRVFALFVPSMTTEAQNALLKTLEEPSANALYFLIVPSPEMMLSTIRSRTQSLELPSGKEEVEGVVDIDTFLAASSEKRLTMLKPLYEHDEDEGRDIGAVIAFLQALEKRFAKSKNHEGLHAIYRARKYVTDKGSLLKSLLEHVALLVPKM